MAARAVVGAYIEDISVRAFDSNPDELYEVIGQEGGVYCLYKHDRLYYVGLATNLFSRIKQHRKDKHSRKWNRFSAYVTKKSQHIREVEALMLRVIAPQGNRQRGKLSGAINLKPEFMKLMKDSQRLHEAEILGGSVAKRKRRKAAKAARGADALSCLVGRRRRLWGVYKGEDYEAVLNSKGQIKYGGKTYESPQASVKAAIGVRRNGWNFWHYRTSKGWVPLKNLR